MDSTPIVIPLENVNDTSVLLAAWLVNDGDQVREGQIIAEMETSKTVIELPAPASGTIALAAQSGVYLEVGVVIGHIIASSADQGDRAQQAPPEKPSEPAPPIVASPSGGVRFSRKALELIQLHNLDTTQFAGRTTVREQDVLNALESSPVVVRKDTNLPFQLQGLSLHGVTLPSLVASGGAGQVDPGFLAYLSRNRATFGRLQSAEKCAEYARNGASVGKDIVIGEGSVIIAPRIVLGNGVEFGDGCDIQCRDSFSIGPLSSFRGGLVARGGVISIGQNVYAGARIQIGGGGNTDPWSLLSVGDNTFLGDDLFINICRPVVIGRDVFLTQRAILVTHNIGHSVLEGYENCFEPIVLEDYCQVGMGSTIYAGVRIGTSAIVASNSYVINSIPEGKLAIGVPARVVRDSKRPIDRNAQFRLARAMVRDFHELLRLKGIQVSPLGADRFSLIHNAMSCEIMFLDHAHNSPAPADPGSFRIVWVLDVKSHAIAGTTVFNLLSKTIAGESNIFVDSAREFLRKRGIRFEPGPWRYRHGLI